MWNPIRHLETLIALQRRTNLLLQEQNALLRELQTAMTGHQPRTPRRFAGEHSVPRTNPQPGAARVKRSGHDVWQRTPLTEYEQLARNVATREASASPSVSNGASITPTPSKITNA